VKLLTSLLKIGLKLTRLGCAIGGLALAAAYFYYAPKLPDVETLRDVQLQTPLRIYSEDNKLVSEFGEKRRTPISFNQIPQNYINALLAEKEPQLQIGRAVQQECRDRSRMPSSA